MKDALPVVTLIAGALLGLITSLVASSIQHRRSVVLKLLDQFLEIRKELVELVCPLTNLDLTTPLSDRERLKTRDKVAQLYYKHYDFLPIQVLDSLIQLQTCLDDPSHGPYAKVDNCIISMPEAQIPRFIDQCSLMNNSKLFVPLVLRSAKSVARTNQIVRLHARHVLFTLNRFASTDAMLHMIQSLRKKV